MHKRTTSVSVRCYVELNQGVFEEQLYVVLWDLYLLKMMERLENI